MARSKPSRKRKPVPRTVVRPRYVVKLPVYEEDDGNAGALAFECFDNAVDCCVALGISCFADTKNKNPVFWFVSPDEKGGAEIARCTEREFVALLSHLSANGEYCPGRDTDLYPEASPHA